MIATTSTHPAAPGPADAGSFTRTTVTAVMAVIAALAFVFSFGNVWALALRLGVPHPIAPLIAPMVDLSVVGLLVAIHHLTLNGTDPEHLASARRLLHLCGLLTLALNTAEPICAQHYGRAALDTVAPLLLLGWGIVGPTLLGHLHTPTPSPAKELAPATDNTPATDHTDTPATPAPTEPSTPDTEPLPAPAGEPAPPATDPAPEPEPEPAPAPVTRPAATVPALLDVPAPLLGAARRIADDHHTRTGDTITVAQLRARLGVAPRLADAVHAHLSTIPA